MCAGAPAGSLVFTVHSARLLANYTNSSRTKLCSVKRWLSFPLSKGVASGGDILPFPMRWSLWKDPSLSALFSPATPWVFMFCHPEPSVSLLWGSTPRSRLVHANTIWHTHYWWSSMVQDTGRGQDVNPLSVFGPIVQSSELLFSNHLILWNAFFIGNIESPALKLIMFPKTDYMFFFKETTDLCPRRWRCGSRVWFS